MSNDDRFDMFPVDCKHVTEKAYLFRYCDEDYWVPRSIVEVVKRNEYQEPIHVTIPVWFAKKSGFYE